MGKDLQYSIRIMLRTAGEDALKRVQVGLTNLGKTTSSFAGIGGGGILGKVLGAQPGGLGGVVAGTVKTLSSIALVPARILSSFATLIPGIGGILGGVVGAAANILQGIVSIAANVVGAIVNVFAGMVKAIVGAFQKLVGYVTGVLGKLVKVGLGVGLGLGAVMVLGVKRNFAEDQLKVILKRRLGNAWQAAWKEIEKVRRFGGFEVSELADALAILSRTDLSNPERYLETIVDTANGARMSLTEVADLFVRMQTMDPGAMGRLGFMLQRIGIKTSEVKNLKSAADLMALLQKRFSGVSREMDRMDPLSNLWRNMKDGVRDLTANLAQALRPALNRLVDLLDRVRGSTGFQRLAEQIGKAGQAAIDFTENALTQTYEYLSTRDWSAAWEGLVELPARASGMLKDIGKLFAEKTAEGWKTGPLIDTAVAGFKALSAYVLPILEDLARKAQKLFADIFGDVIEKFADSLQKIAEKPLEERRIKAVDYWLKAAQADQSRFEKGMGDIYKQRAAQEYAYAEQLQAAPAGHFTGTAGGALPGLGPVAAERYNLFSGSAQGIRNTVAAMRRAPLDREEQAAQDIEAARNIDKATEELGAASERLAAAGRAIGAEAAGLVRGALPAGPAGAAPARSPFAPVPEPTSGQMDLARRIASKERLAQMLRQSGYTEKADTMTAAIEEMRDGLRDMLSVQATTMEAQAEMFREINRRLKEHDRKMKALATAGR